MSVSSTAPRPLPLFGQIARGLGHGVNMVFVLLAFAMVVLALCVMVWGPVALTIAALPMVPAMFVFFIWISLP